MSGLKGLKSLLTHENLSNAEVTQMMNDTLPAVFSCIEIPKQYPTKFSNEEL